MGGPALERHRAGLTGTHAYFAEYRALVQGWYERADRTSSLSEVNSIFISGIAVAAWHCDPDDERSRLSAEGTKSEKVLSMVRAPAPTVT